MAMTLPDRLFVLHRLPPPLANMMPRTFEGPRRKGYYVSARGLPLKRVNRVQDPPIFPSEIYQSIYIKDINLYTRNIYAKWPHRVANSDFSIIRLAKEMEFCWNTRG